jgi:ribonuclease HII
MRRPGAHLERRFARLRGFDHDMDPTAWSTGRLVGVDEAGVGPLAGPVVAAAVILPPEFAALELYDSKQMSAQQRQRCERIIRTTAVAVAVARVSPRLIDRVNILNAMLHAQRRALELLPRRPQTVLVDGRRVPRLPAGWNGVRVRAIVRGDSQSLAVAAASVVAKSVRDRIMLRLEERYPGYGFGNHKGYATLAHKDAVRRLGLSPAHRRSFCAWLDAERASARQASLQFE